MRYGFRILSVLAALIGLIFVLRPGVVCDALGWGCEESRARSCLQATGSTVEYTPGFSPSGASFSAHLGGKEVIVGTQDSEALRLILGCIREASINRRSGPADDFYAEEPIQFGRIAELWRGGAVTIGLIEPVDQKVRDGLMNLAFGPAGGLRREIIGQWCENNSACIQCEMTDSKKRVTVMARAGGKFEKHYIGTAPLSGNRAEPYQLVEADDVLPDGIGRRVIYQCVE